LSWLEPHYTLIEIRKNRIKTKICGVNYCERAWACILLRGRKLQRRYYERALVAQGYKTTKQVATAENKLKQKKERDEKPPSLKNLETTNIQPYIMIHHDHNCLRGLTKRSSCSQGGKASTQTVKHSSKTEQRSNQRPSIRQRSDDGGKASTKMRVAAKHSPVEHKTAGKHPLEMTTGVDMYREDATKGHWQGRTTTSNRPPTATTINTQSPDGGRC
jgi:hypothetical protein